MKQEHLHGISQWIKTRASELGFAACGITQAGYLEKDDDHLRNWLSLGYQGEMSYMERNHDLRTDPRELLPGARSVICFLLNYFPAENPSSENNYKIAKYAYGQDYHAIIKNKLKQLIKELREKTGDMQARAFTDSAPILERAWAEKAGLGWIGKNTCLISPTAGSFVFLAEIITDLELEYDIIRVNDLCGGCTKSIEACPAQAIIGPHLLDSRKCISYLTIEYHGELPAGQKENFNDWIFGCDICQDVCPWNRKTRAHEVKEFLPHSTLLKMTKEKWKELMPEKFNSMFSKSAVKRTKYEGLKRNISFLAIAMLLLVRSVFGFDSGSLFTRPDTIPPPPPGMTDTITGPSQSCKGEISLFSIGIPLDCSCQWAVNGIIQQETAPELMVTWVEPGLNTVSVATICQGGSTDPRLKNVLVMYQPEVDLGNDTAIIMGETLLLDAGNPGSEYLWSTGETTRTIEVSQTGDYSVNVGNFCGLDSDTVQVTFVVSTEEIGISIQNLHISVKGGKIFFQNLPANSLKIQLFSLNGNMLIESAPVKELAVPWKGLFLLRIISEEYIYSRKIMIR